MNVSLYLHVPFCRSKCPYCDFYSVRFDPEVNKRYIQSLIRELRRRGPLLRGRVVDTVYFGGGTPSLLALSDVERILDATSEVFVLNQAEISMECNPTALGQTYLEGLRQLGINRLSIGLQALDDESLEALGRAHTTREGIRCFDMARKAGFENLSMDLIYGIPGQTLHRWRQTLEQTVRLSPDHVSVYELTLDGPSPMRQALNRGSVLLPPEDTVIRMYTDARDMLCAAGLQHYEISNYARGGAECRHNVHCWKYGEYIGAGPAAHSHFGGRRFWNADDVDTYIRTVENTGCAEWGGETLSPRERHFERTVLGLRMKKGIEVSSVPKNLIGLLHGLRRRGLVEENNGWIRLTDAGMLVSNEVFLRFG